MEESIRAVYAVNSGHFYKSIRQFFGISPEKEDKKLREILENERRRIQPVSYSPRDSMTEPKVPKKHIEIYNSRGEIVRRDSPGIYIDFKF